MRKRAAFVWLAVAAASVLLTGCQKAGSATERPAVNPVQKADHSAPEKRVLRVTGLVQAVKARSIRVPQLSGQGGRITLVRLIPNGSRVNEGELLAEFDKTTFLDDERDAVARLRDLEHQLAEKRAQADSDQTRRASSIGDTQADLDKALIQLKKGEVISEIDRLKADARAANARERLASLKRSDAHRRKLEEATVGILDLKVKRQQVVLDRIRSNMAKLEIKAPQSGMVALENTWRNGSMGPAQEGDQMWPGQPLVRIFDPSQMVVDATVNEPDFNAASRVAAARMRVDAYPSMTFDAELETASPVATAALESPVRTFNARFRVKQQDPRLLPDLSASLEIELEKVSK